MRLNQEIRRIIVCCGRAAVVLVLAGAAAAHAQTVSGSLVGTVTDRSGAVLPGAAIVITDVERGTKRESVTNTEGQYTLSSLEPGPYQVAIEMTGFKKFVRDRVDVAINTTVRVDAKLDVGGVTETVEVSGARPVLQTDRSDLTHQITPVQLENLPLSLDNNYQSLLELAPGVTEANDVGSAFGNPNGSVVNRVNGQNERANSFQLDGTINNQTNVISQTAIVPPHEAIEVVDVSTNAYDAEQGRSTGGVTNVQIKSGTNTLRGTLSAYHTDGALKARNALSSLPQPDTKLSQGTFTIGGPIRRNRTFFFGDYQRGRDRRGQNDLHSVIPLAFRNGDFSGASTTIFDPASGSITQRTAFPGNIIPQNRISPVAQAILARLPNPTGAGNTLNYEATGQFVQDRNSGDIKVNHSFGNRTQGFVRYSYFQADTADPPSFGVLGGPSTGGGGTAAIGDARNQSGALNLTRAFSPKVVAEFRAGFVRVNIQGASPTEADLATQVGIPGINTGDFFTGGLPRINISGYDFLGIAATLPFKIVETSYNVVNNWTVQKGRHTIRFGADLRNLGLDKAQATGDPRGTFTFTTGPTALSGGPTTSSANAVAAFLLGLPQSVARTQVNQLSGYELQQYFFFAQDRWQPTSRLSLNYGLRYEIYPYATVPNAGDQSTYLPETNEILVAGYGSVSKRLNVKTDYGNFAPRLGIAYRIDDKTVFRGGYGVGYIPLGINTLANVSYPAQISLSMAGANSFTPVGSLSTGIPVVPVVDVSSGVVASPPGNVILPVVNTDPKRGYVQSFNVTLQRDLFGFVVDASYVGAIGKRLPGTLNLNAAGPGAVQANRPLAIRFGRTADTLFSDFVLGSEYHALQSKLERRLGRAGKITAAYTLSRSEDDSGAFTVQNPIDLSVNRGPSNFDRKHNLVISHVTPFPFGR
ncbi:MAG TPA: TonB-dependent receptor, partial [Vicinamibacterales bacterium]|nr:TonB-dependent receptor [Vicinamibacterales bacterium]